MSRLGITLVGAKEAIETLKLIPDNLQRKHMRIALNAAGGVIKNQVVALVPVETKLLRQSQSVKVKQKQNSEWYVAVGAKRGMKRAVRTTRAGTTKAFSKKATGNLKFTPGGNRYRRVDPARYGHLAEKGTRSHEVTAKYRKVLYGGGEFYGTQVRIRARGSRFLQRASFLAGPRATFKAITKLREAALSYAKN